MIMKKFRFFLLSLAIIAGVSVARAEQGDNAVGFNLGYAVGSNNIGNFGIGIKYSYSLSDALRIQPSFTYYFDKDEVYHFKDVSLDFHYLFNIGSDDNLFFYPIFGAAVPFAKLKFADDKGVVDEHTWTRFGCNLGAGLQYNITDDFGIVGEAKYKVVKDIDHFSINIGCVVTF